MLRARTAQFEADVQELINTSQLGHANPKQKLQYHLRCVLRQDAFYLKG